jgi:hypothetical protein
MFFGMGFAILLLVAAPVVDKLQVRLWNGKWYARAILPDASKVELKSDTDLTYSEWIALFEQHWEAMQNEEPNLPVLYENATYAIRDPNDGNLILEWKPDDVRLNITETNLPALRNSTTRMNTIFEGMP